MKKKLNEIIQVHSTLVKRKHQMLRGHLGYRKKLTTPAKTSETGNKDFIL